MKSLNKSTLKESLHDVIFGTESFAGKLFDTVLIVLILANVVSVMLESVVDINYKYKNVLHTIDWFFTVIFTIEYLLRIYCAQKRQKYVTGFFGLVDLFSVLPVYLALVIPQSRFLFTIRLLRILRIFRIFKMASYIKEAEQLLNAIKISYRRIVVFILFILTLVSILGSMMYVVERGTNGFTSIPKSIYWAVVTLTTVGYGDISPVTTIGRLIAAVIMIMGYSLIVVPMGFVASSFREEKPTPSTIFDPNYIKASLIRKTVEFWEQDLRRLEHAMDVLIHSEKISKEYDNVDMKVLWTVALLHDVGIKPAEAEFGYNTAKLQEKYGPEIALNLISDLSFDKEQLKRISDIIATHHSITDINWPELLILKRADSIINGSPT